VAPVPVLLYHDIGAHSGRPITAYTASAAAFARHMDLIVGGGHTAITVSEFGAALRGERPVPPRAVVVTFDDGYRDTLDVAAPILRDRGLAATVYVTTGHLPGCPLPAPRPALPSMLEFSRLHDLEAAGLEIGSHSHSHPHLDIVPKEHAREEVLRSRDLLQDALGHRVTTFAYPHGCADNAVRSIVRQAGFTSACAVRNALSHPTDDPFNIARLTVLATTTDGSITRWLAGEGAHVARSRERLRTTAWRCVRRVRHRAGYFL
jgi:peptidoglycan/xylan/chitin deacetylase (PgdA/CDA1 family)